MVGWYLKAVDPVLARVWKVSNEKSAYDLLKWEVEREAWVREFHEKARVLSFPPIYKLIYDEFWQVWDAQGFDAIIGPGLASPALIHKYDQMTLILFTILISCGSVPPNICWPLVQEPYFTTCLTALLEAFL